NWGGVCVAGGAAGGANGATRLGGNGVANWTVCGGMAGDSRAAWLPGGGAPAPPDAAVLDFELARAAQPFARPAGDLNRLRERLLDVMWGDVGVIRNATRLARGRAAIDELEAQLLGNGPRDRERALQGTLPDPLH